MLREYTVEDLDIINEIGSQIKEDFVNKYDVINIKNRDYEDLFVYVDNDIVKGFIHIEKHIDFIDIINIAVDKNYQREGIGSKLLDNIINKYNLRILLEVRESNTSALKLYEKFNFKEINRRHKYYGNEDAIVMERSI